MGRCRHDAWSGRAGTLAGWAAARLDGADRLRFAEAWAVPLLSFTPQVTAGAWAGALLLRGVGPAAAAGPRAVPYRQPPAAGPVLRVLTANLLAGWAVAEAVAELACRTHADVLFVQELTGDAAAGLQRAGLGDLLQHQVTQPGPHARGRAPPGLTFRLGSSCSWPASTRRRRSLRVLRRRGPVAQSAVRAARARWQPRASSPATSTPPSITQFRRLLRSGYVDAASQAGHGLSPTWGPRPGRRPTLLAIDHVLTDRRCAVLTISAHWLTGSDHRALYAELEFPAPHSRWDQTSPKP
jgi:endonuclease/exonuclease/phosphatase family metal-dependent hydrolase